MTPPIYYYYYYYYYYSVGAEAPRATKSTAAPADGSVALHYRFPRSIRSNAHRCSCLMR